MKKICLLALFACTTTIFAAQMKIPTEIEDEIYKSAVGMSGTEKREYINWQSRAYISMMDELSSSGLPKNEQERIKTRLSLMYGANYNKQYQMVSQEIEAYNEVVRRVSQAVGTKIDPNKNIQAQNDLTNMSKNGVNEIPNEALSLILDKAKELYPGNFIEQKRYVDSIIEIYPNLIKILNK